MGAVAISNVRRLGQFEYEFGKEAVLAKITMSNSYATNGDTVAGAVTLGLPRVTGMLVVAHDVSGSGVNTYGRVLGVDVASPVKGYTAVLAGTQAAPKIKLVKGGTTQVEETNATDASSHIFWAVFIGENHQ